MRRAELDDLPHIVAMADRFHAATGQIAPFDHGAMSGLAARMIESDESCLLVTGGGMIGGMLCPAYCAPSYVMAIELFWWAEDGSGLQLLRGFESWAAGAGAAEVRMSSMARMTGADKILKRRGYSAAEISYSKVVAC